jgi:hypothetical protein
MRESDLWYHRRGAAAGKMDKVAGEQAENNRHVRRRGNLIACEQPSEQAEAEA